MLAVGAAEAKLVIRNKGRHGAGSAQHGGVDSKPGGTGADPTQLTSGVLFAAVPTSSLWNAPQCVPWPRDGGAEGGGLDSFGVVAWSATHAVDVQLHAV